MLRTRMMSLVSRSAVLGLALVLSVSLTGCNGGGGGGGSTLKNPAPTPGAKATIDMTGVWICTESKITEDNGVVVPDGWGVNAEITLSKTMLVEDDDGFAYTRANIEKELGLPLNHFVNQADGRLLDFQAMYDRRGQGGQPQGWPIYLHNGMMLAAIDAKTLVGFEAEIGQETQTSAQYRWVYSLTWKRK